MPSRRQNAVRIIGGEWRRRLLEFPDAPDLRPTPDRMRETLFNWLGQDLTGETCLDLFAGSGALGFEAASRGARQSVLVERDAAIIRTLVANKTTLSASQVEIVRADAMAFLKSDTRRYDVVFVDPPYRLNLLPRIFPLLGRILAPDARVYAESDKAPDLPAGYELLRQGRAGQVHCLLLKWLQT
ncbi:MAG TPA: 16S rRNA (guanine(966)-N(2))-methyltransferase RsmD [Burkholderiales bacterium]|nr:16S rRNA (guanine(966)-N(2))-methyltransferase RsmD [Burkholderiales bacterium]